MDRLFLPAKIQFRRLSPFDCGPTPCSYHSPEKFLTLSLGLGSLVKKALSTERLSLDRSKIESMFKEIQAIRSRV